MARFLPTITLGEAFRRILRAIYPDWPALADEVQSYMWVFGPVGPDWWVETNLTSDEVIAVNKAFDLLDGRVARGKIRLRGVLDPSKPLGDIDPADARVGKLHIVAGELRIFLNNKLVRTYRQVHCYETDVNRCVAELRSETKRAKRTTESDFVKFKTRFLNSGVPLTEAAITQAAEREGINRPRQDLRNALPPNRRRGPRRKSPGK